MNGLFISRGIFSTSNFFNILIHRLLVAGSCPLMFLLMLISLNLLNAKRKSLR